MPVFQDLTGKVFGRLTAIEKAPKRSEKEGIYWLCRCECGTTAEIKAIYLTIGDTKSCGCLKTRRPNISKLVKRIPELTKREDTEDTEEFTERKMRRLWRNVLWRCSEKATERTRKNYFDKGISVSAEFKDFSTFSACVLERLKAARKEYPGQRLHLDRINNAKGYSKDNVRMVPAGINYVNQAKKRSNKSGYTGVAVHKRRQAFEAVARINGKRFWLGIHQTAEEAAMIRDRFFIKAGVKAMLNFDLSKYEDMEETKRYRELFEGGGK